MLYFSAARVGGNGGSRRLPPGREESNSDTRFPSCGTSSRTSAASRASLRPRVDPGATEDIVLDEAQVRVEGERLVIHVAALRIRADEENGCAEAVAVASTTGGTT
jgi:hypothetical protein